MRSPRPGTHSAGADRAAFAGPLRPDSSGTTSELPLSLPRTPTPSLLFLLHNKAGLSKPPEGSVRLISVSTVPSRSIRLLQTAGFPRAAEFRSTGHASPSPTPPPRCPQAASTGRLREQRSRSVSAGVAPNLMFHFLWTGQTAALHFTVLKTLHTLLHSGCTGYTPHQQYKCSFSLHTLVNLIFFKKLTSLLISERRVGSAVLVHELSCPAAHAILPDQGSSPCPPVLASGFLSTEPPREGLVLPFRC